MPYLTPDEVPEGGICRPLVIPASSEWLAIVSGALTELTKPYNWEQFGTLTVAEAVAAMETMIGEYYFEPCTPCETPGGFRVIRISPTGHIEQLNSDGEWEPGSGDYYIPPPEAREGGTSDEQICLAAANAVNALHELYENLSDSWNGELDTAEALTAFVAGVVSVIGFAAAPIAFGIVSFFIPIFTALYSALEYLFADLWDEDVSKQIECFLVECASNDAGVVTFDYACFTAKLNSIDTGFGLTAEQIRLYIQIAYLLYCIGGVDMLNLAGATTAITEADCDECTYCHVWEGSDLEAWEFFCCFGSGGDRGHYDIGELFSDNGTEAGGAPNSTELMARVVFPAPATITSIKIQFGKTLGDFETALGAVGDKIIVDSPNGFYNGTVISDVVPTQFSPWVWTGSQAITDELTIWMFAALFSNAGCPGCEFGDIDIYSIRICFDGFDPFSE